MVVTALDCLSYLEELKVCVAYDIDGEITKDFPVTPRLKKAKPVYKTFKGWHCDIRGIRNYEDLPKITSISSSRRSRHPSPWCRTARRAMRSSIARSKSPTG